MKHYWKWIQEIKQKKSEESTTTKLDHVEKRVSGQADKVDEMNQSERKC